MEKHTCKLCFRNFANGRALGGHMRSHVAAAKAKQQQQHDECYPSSASASSTSSHEAEDAAERAEGYVLRENPRKSFRLVDPEFSSTFVALDAGSVVQDRESETESPPHPPHPPHPSPPAQHQRRRSKRRRRAGAEHEPVSSVSDTTPEEDVALSLMMLSRDAWTRDEDACEEEQQQQQQNSDDSASEEAATPAAAAPARQAQGKGRSRYQCGTCKKVFRSYQALGGHRASHKKSNTCSPPDHADADANADPEASRAHECPVCFRVFSSGQALGGHKRSHLVPANATSITITSSSPAAPPPPPPSPSMKFRESLIDLNLPAPMEDDVELSAVSDAEFVRAPRTPY